MMEDWLMSEVLRPVPDLVGPEGSIENQQEARSLGGAELLKGSHHGPCRLARCRCFCELLIQ